MELLKVNKFIQSNFTFDLLHGWSIVKVTGLDSKKYLQNHVTIDLVHLKNQQHMLCAHCNAKGKVNSTLRLFHNTQDYFYIQRSSICNMQINELQKYAVFSKIQIERLNNYFFLGLSGTSSKEFLLSYFPSIPNRLITVVFSENNIILWFGYPIERFLLIITKKKLLYFKKILSNYKIPSTKDYWLYLDMISGIPILEKSAFQKFFPKEINLDFLGGININKGCYCGQEIISKMHFRNISHKKMYCLIGVSNVIVNVFSILEVYDGCMWKKNGYVLFSVCMQGNIFVMQCVMNTKNVNKNKFRLAIDVSSCFTILHDNII